MIPLQINPTPLLPLPSWLKIPKLGLIWEGMAH